MLDCFTGAASGLSSRICTCPLRTGLQREGNIEAECGAVVIDILVGEDDRHLDRDRGRVVHEHELLQGLATKLVLGDALNGKAGTLDCGVLVPPGDADVTDTKQVLGLRCTRGFLEEERVRTGLGDGVQGGAQWGERFVPPVRSEQEIGLRAMVLGVVDLAVKEAVLEDGLASWNGVSPRSLARAKEAKVLGELVNPEPRRRCGYPHAERSADTCRHGRAFATGAERVWSLALGARCRDRGVLEESCISNDEQGLRRKGIEQAELPAQALGTVSVQYLLCLDDEGFLSQDEHALVERLRRTDARGRGVVRAVLGAVEQTAGLPSGLEGLGRG